MSLRRVKNRRSIGAPSRPCATTPRTHLSVRPPGRKIAGMGFHAPANNSTLHRVPEKLPAPLTADWVNLSRRMMDYFLTAHRDVQPRLIVRQLLIIHPNQVGLLEQARAIHNEEVSPDSDADGNVIILPRVWRWEHFFHVFFVIELPPSMNARSILLWTGDRELDTA